MHNFTVKKVVAVGIGSAVYIILAKFVAIPMPLPNVTLQTTYGFLALMGFLFGPLVAMLVALIGHTLTDMLSYGSVWFSWVIASGFFGLGMGLLGKKISLKPFGKKEMIAFIIGQSFIAAITWAAIAPILDILIYSEPLNKVFTQGIAAGLMNALATAILGSLLLIGYAKTLVKAGSLTKKID